MALATDTDIPRVLDAMESQALGARAEYIGGVFTLNRPRPNHQRAIQRVIDATSTPDGMDLVPEIRVGDGESWIVPDIVAIDRDNNDAIVHPSDVHLMVEVLSTSTEQRDRTHKREFAARHGIDYWIVITTPDALIIEAMPYGGGTVSVPNMS